MRASKSIVLITVDCLRADHVGFMGYERPTTPFLDSLAAESFVFPVAIVGGAPTYYSLPTILASRYPLALGRDVLGLAPREPTLASVLKEHGYVTAAFSAANPYISERFGYEQGFDTFRDFLDELVANSGDGTNEASSNGWLGRLNRMTQAVRPKLGPLSGVYDELYFQYCQRWATPAARSLDALRKFPPADVLVDHACKWLASVGDAPFFLWLHLMDPHAPYYPTDQALSLMSSVTTPFRARYLNSYWNRGDLGPTRFVRYRDEVVSLYDAGIRWIDLQMERLAGVLRKSKMWENCIFALTADHGEEFLDHGGRFHPPSRLMEELIHVPLLVRVPGAEKKEISNSPFSLVHLAPTLLDAAAVAIPPEFHGRSLWRSLGVGANQDSFAISECVAGCTNPFHAENRMGPRVLSVRESRYKLVLHFDAQADVFYDLEADPREQSPLAPDSQKPIRQRLLEVAREHVRKSASQGEPELRLRARLRDLQLEWKKPADKVLPALS
jgi:arylsulfatase A-like enzyme